MHLQLPLKQLSNDAHMKSFGKGHVFKDSTILIHRPAV